MVEQFLKLPPAEQAEIIHGVASQLGKAPAVLEKDVWVCWTLNHLFRMPGRLPMVFKGGTSLSKVFNAISRFSEDVDVTLDYRGLDTTFDPFAEGVSKNQIRNFSDRLKMFVQEHARDVVGPYFHQALKEQLGTGERRVDVSDNGEEVRIYYPSVLDPAEEYLRESVLVEFGGRNITEPSQVYEIRPFLSESVPALEFPVAQANVLSPMRTFWEKATLIHVECNRGEIRAGADRLSRHWYDLAMLSDQDIGKEAVRDRALLADVVKHKKVFFYAAYADYDACLSGHLRLVPDNGALAALKVDFTRMISAGMFFVEPPSFDEIVERLRRLEIEINC